MSTVKLNVGGRVFETTKTTLEAVEFFQILLNHTRESGNPNTLIFVDRSPEIFEHVLALLRDPQYLYPEDYLSELEFFGLDPPARIRLSQSIEKEFRSQIAELRVELRTLQAEVQILRPSLPKPRHFPDPDGPFPPPIGPFSIKPYSAPFPPPRTPGFSPYEPRD